MSSPLSILHIGLPDGHPCMPKDLEPKIKQALTNLRSIMKERGINYHQEFYSPETGLDAFVRKLTSQSWSGIVIGGGLFGHPEMTYFLERVVHAAHGNAPDAVIMFTHDPSEAPEAIDRWFRARDVTAGV